MPDNTRTERITQAARGPKTVLVIDADAWMRSLQADLLIREGYATLLAPDGQAGVQMAEAQRPDLIVLDAALSGTTGLDVLRDLRRRGATRAVPVILVSAYAGLLQGAEMLGVSAILQKPIDVADLLGHVKQVLAA